MPFICASAGHSGFGIAFAAGVFALAIVSLHFTAMSAVTLTPDFDVAVYDQLTSPEWSSFLCTATWKCNYRYAIENVMDPMHGSYLHAESPSMAEGHKTAEFVVRKTDSGLVFEKVGQLGVNFDWVE